MRRSVLPLCNPLGAIGTATVIEEGLVLTALHVIARQDPEELRVGDAPGLPVLATATIPIGDYRDARVLARRSQRRARRLAGDDADIGIDTVDLVLLAVPGLHSPPLRARATPVTVGEPVVVPGYPGGHWNITRGPVTETDDADFAARLLSGPGSRGAPVLDLDSRLVGMVSVVRRGATVCTGPHLLSTFLHQLLTPCA